MTVFDTKFRALAKNLIGKFGVTTGVYTSIGVGVMNDDTNSIEMQDSAQQNLVMSPPVRFDRRDIDGTLITYDDFRVYIAAPDFEDAFTSSTFPKTSDILEINGITLSVIQPNPIYSGELVAAYRLQVRKGQNAL